MIENTFEKLQKFFTEKSARFRVMEHAANAQSSLSASEIRGTALGQGIKALVCQTKGNGIRRYVLAILPADFPADLQKVAESFGAKKASLVSADEVMKLTGCTPGAVPPVSFHPELTLVADPLLFERFDELAFNAGRHDRSIIIATEDFKLAIDAKLVSFHRESA